MGDRGTASAGGSRLAVFLFGGVLVLSLAGVGYGLFRDDGLSVDTGQTLTVAGTSMEPTLHAGDRVRLQEVSPEDLRRGDVVAVRFRTRERLMVKRIIALGGDRVERDAGIVRVNGEPLDMEGWPAERRVPARAWKVVGLQLKRYEGRVPDDSLIVMGDNGRKSYDSGDFGLLSIRQIAGRVIW